MKKRVGEKEEEKRKEERRRTRCRMRNIFFLFQKTKIIQRALGYTRKIINQKNLRFIYKFLSA